MTEKVTAANIDGIANPVFRDYVRRYVDIGEGFREAVAAFGVSFAEEGVKNGDDRDAAMGSWLSGACGA